MKIYRLSRADRLLGSDTQIIRFKAEDYDDALRTAERIEVMEGVFGDDTIEPNGPMILLTEENE